MNRRESIFAARLAELLEEFSDLPPGARSLALYGEILMMLTREKHGTPTLADVAALSARLTQQLAGVGLVAVPAQPVTPAPARKRAKK